MRKIIIAALMLLIALISLAAASIMGHLKMEARLEKSVSLCDAPGGYIVVEQNDNEYTINNYSKNGKKSGFLCFSMDQRWSSILVPAFYDGEWLVLYLHEQEVWMGGHEYSKYWLKANADGIVMFDYELDYYSDYQAYPMDGFVGNTPFEQYRQDKAEAALARLRDLFCRTPAAYFGLGAIYSEEQITISFYS